MPLVEPVNLSGHFLREKILLTAPGKVGKSSSWASIAWWAFHSGDTRIFYVLDTDDEAVLQVLNEAKYAGMLRSVNGELVNEGGNIVLFGVDRWPDYKSSMEKVAAETRRGDWIIVDFITHAWSEVQEDYLRSEKGKSKATAMLDADRAGLSGWDAFKLDYNYQVINPNYFEWFKSFTVQTDAHIFLVAEQDEIQENSKKLTDDAKDHLQKFGKYKAIGQKKLPYQCRTFLRMSRVARGRLLYTQGDRARKELDGDECRPDFMTAYMKNIAGWTITDPE